MVSVRRVTSSSIEEEEGAWAPSERHQLLSKLLYSLERMEEAGHMLDHNSHRWAIKHDVDRIHEHLASARTIARSLLAQIRKVAT